MRDIRFRAWDKTAQKFVHMALNPRAGFSYEVIGKDEDYEAHDYEDWEQFTGLHDENGDEIYEGDIVEFTVFDQYRSDTQYTGKIIWNEECAFMLVTTDPMNDYWYLSWVKLQDDGLEIVGNIHENPELLNPTKSCSLEGYK